MINKAVLVRITINSAYFLSNFILVVDVAHRRLVNTDSYLLTSLQHSPSVLVLHISAPTDAYAYLHMSYLEVFRPDLRQAATAPANHGIYHHIKTTGPPLFAIFRCLAPDQLAAAKQTLAGMEEIGLCQKGSSPWSSPFHIILKKDGSLRKCRDYKA
ncbi:uncharacterized protein [Palaemon carinicauda]|uniref:uncharacterized protein n=1 Tax=Palaemon carinicauda TaxID=392227 RepID=UPI0035B6789E